MYIGKDLPPEIQIFKILFMLELVTPGSIWCEWSDNRKNDGHREPIFLLLLLLLLRLSHWRKTTLHCVNSTKTEMNSTRLS